MSLVRAWFPWIAGVLALALVIGLYRIKTEAQETSGAVRTLDRDVAEARAEVRELRAEIAALDSPARVDALARQRLELAPGAGARARREAELAGALPAPEARAPR